MCLLINGENDKKVQVLRVQVQVQVLRNCTRVQVPSTTSLIVHILLSVAYGTVLGNVMSDTTTTYHNRFTALFP